MSADLQLLPRFFPAKSESNCRSPISPGSLCSVLEGESVKLQNRNILACVLVCACALLTPSARGQGSLEKVAVSLHDGWFVQSSANTTATGAQISTPGFSTAGWLATSIPATPGAAQVQAGVYTSP